MIKFFRKIRQNLLSESKTGEYLKYAVGEIILVVIGILIALQINNWNEERKAQKEEQQLYKTIITDLKTDASYIETTINELKFHQDIHYHMYFEAIGEATFDPNVKYGSIRWNMAFAPLTKDNHQEVVSRISNDNIRALMNNYFRSQDEADIAINTFNIMIVELIRPYLTQHNIMDTKEVYEQPRYKFLNPRDTRHIIYEELRNQYKTPEFYQLLFELRVKTTYPILNLNILLDANKNLQEMLQSVIE